MKRDFKPVNPDDDLGPLVELPLDPLPDEDVVEPISWTLTGALAATLLRGKYRYGTFIQAVFGDWQVIGLITPRDANDLDKVFDQHVHQNLGEYGELEQAREAAMVFLRTAPEPTAACSCVAALPTLETSER